MTRNTPEAKAAHTTMRHSVMHARAGVTGDASVCGLSNAAHVTLDNARVTCPKCKRTVDKQVADANANIAASRASVPTHLIVDVTDRPGTRKQTTACGWVVAESTTNVTRNRTLVTCTGCLDDLREGFAPNPLNAPAPTDDRAALVAALESVILVAEDCQQRWSRSHPATVAAARAVLTAAKART